MDTEAAKGFRSTTVLRIFPTFVWKGELQRESYAPINRCIIGKLNKLRRAAPSLKPGEGWQSGHDLHTLPELHGLVSYVKTAVASVLDFLRVGHEGFEITGCWANIYAPGVAHRMHHHPNNYLSGVYYVQTQEGAETINFHDPRHQTGIIRPPATVLTAENTDQVVVRVKKGTLLIFPAWLPHSVDPNKSRKIRVSVSFNVMFSSYAEKMSKPLW